jgi:hypothetical protein
MFYVVIKRERCALYYDSTLFAGFGYTLAYILLGLSAHYYYMPAIIMFLPSFVYWAKYLYQKRKKYSLLYFYIIILIYTYNGMIVQNVIHNLYERKECMKYFTCLLSNYHQGNKFIWYESDNTVNANTFYIAVRNWRKVTENTFLNYVNETEDHDFFALRKELHAVEFHKDILFFYPVDNDQNQPMPENLAAKLAENHFELYKDAYGVLVYKRR